MCLFLTGSDGKKLGPIDPRNANKAEPSTALWNPDGGDKPIQTRHHPEADAFLAEQLGEPLGTYRLFQVARLLLLRDEPPPPVW